MRLLLLILISLSWLLVLPAARAQWLTADDFFNDGAHSYISNNIPQALQSVQNGLQRYPDDEKLKKLYELLKQQQQQQNQQNQSQKNQQQNSGQQNQQQNQQNQPNQNQGQQKQPQPNPADKNQNGSKAGETNGEPQTAGVAQMTPEEAKRLLDQQKNNEQILAMKPRGKPQDTSHPIKDW